MDVVERIVIARESFTKRTLLEPDSLFVTPHEMEELRSIIPNAECDRVLGMSVYQFDGITELYCERLGVWMPPVESSHWAQSRQG